ncbi:MAG: EamA family transporter [Casimicrobium sp.]
MSNRFLSIAGLLAGFVSALIAASWQTATRYGVTSSLLASDLATLRYGIPALVLAPLLWKQGVLPAHVHRGWFVLMVTSGGIGYGALAMMGARYSPVAHMGILLSGTVPLFTALLLYATTHVVVNRQRLVGYTLILMGRLRSVSQALAYRSPTFGTAIFFSFVRRSAGRCTPWHYENWRYRLGMRQRSFAFGRHSRRLRGC